MTFLSNDLSHVTVTAVLPALLTSGAVAALGTLEGYEHRQITVLLCFSWTVK